MALWFSKPDISEVCLFGAGPSDGVPDVGLEPLAPQGYAPFWWDPCCLCIALPARVGFWVRPTSLALLPLWSWPFYPLLWRSCSASFQVLQRIVLYVAVDLECLSEIINSGSSYASILNHLCYLHLLKSMFY